MSDAAASPKHDPSCIFCKIAAGQIPSRKVLETDEFIVFHDIAPWAPVHVLMVPREHIATLYDAEERHAGMWGADARARPEPDAGSAASATGSGR